MSAGPPAISARSLGKQYRLGVTLPTYRMRRQRLANLVRRRSPADAPGTRPQTMWALRDVSFDIAEGEVVGLVGRNGAGKSTLLKILSRITEPTEGSATIHGRVGSLLEVGTGFNPELTGRENVFLNGAVLGMKKSEIRRKFDEIVAFSEIETFIDTPVKRYSSGMYVRLAFAVAAHLEPEVMLVDEVLAVGDAGFQKKCLGKMSTVSREGRTIVFVSHNMGAVAELCPRSMLIDEGQVVMDGPTSEVTAAYLGLFATPETGAELPENPLRPASFLGVRTLDANGEATNSFDVAEPITITIRYRVRIPVTGLLIRLTLARNMFDLFQTFDCDEELEPIDREPGDYEATYTIPPMFLKAGAYTVSVYGGKASPEQEYQNYVGVLSFEVEERSFNTHHKGYRRDRPGSVVGQGTWRTERVG
jgi:lipopolysaccharide transport system ATP-binding protein